ncbi:Deoxyuridine 5'-triphosphate nucleotidohydrolase, partial [Clarias magur]
ETLLRHSRAGDQKRFTSLWRKDSETDVTSGNTTRESVFVMTKACEASRDLSHHPIAF